MRALAALAYAVVCAAGCAPLSPDELACENAVARIEKCCNIEARAIPCHHSGSVEPSISEHEADCILRMGCAEMASTGTCSRASGFQPGSVTGVCP